MPAPVPRREIDELVNLLGPGRFPTLPQVEQALWRVRPLLRNTSDLRLQFEARMMAGALYLLKGERAEAIPHVEIAYSLRSHAEARIVYNLFITVIGAGLQEKARTVAEEEFARRERDGAHQRDRMAAVYGLRYGDIDFLQRAIETEIRAGLDDTFTQRAWRILQRDGLACDLAKHQQVVERLVNPAAVWFGCAIVDADEARASVAVRYWTNLDRQDRKALRRELHHAILQVSSPERSLIGTVDVVLSGLPAEDTADESRAA